MGRLNEITPFIFYLRFDVIVSWDDWDFCDFFSPSSSLSLESVSLLLSSVKSGSSSSYLVHHKTLCNCPRQQKLEWCAVACRTVSEIMGPSANTVISRLHLLECSSWIYVACGFAVEVLVVGFDNFSRRSDRLVFLQYMGATRGGTGETGDTYMVRYTFYCTV